MDDLEYGMWGLEDSQFEDMGGRFNDPAWELLPVLGSGNPLDHLRALKHIEYAFRTAECTKKSNPRKQFGMRENDDCKRCDGSMRVRINRFTEEMFLGCSNYPDCKFSDDLMTSEKNRIALERKVEEKSFYKF